MSPLKEFNVCYMCRRLKPVALRLDLYHRTAFMAYVNQPQAFVSEEFIT